MSYNKNTEVTAVIYEPDSVEKILIGAGYQPRPCLGGSLLVPLIVDRQAHTRFELLVGPEPPGMDSIVLTLTCERQLQDGLKEAEAVQKRVKEIQQWLCSGEPELTKKLKLPEEFLKMVADCDYETEIYYDYGSEVEVDVMTRPMDEESLQASIRRLMVFSFYVFQLLESAGKVIQ